MKIYLTVLFIICLSLTSKEQEPLCTQAKVFCGSNPFTYKATCKFPCRDAGEGYPAEPGPCYSGSPGACLLTQPNPAWFFLQISDPGTIVLTISSDPPADIDFECWGPFTSPTGACLLGLSCDKIIACSYNNGTAPEICTIPNAQPNEFYMLVLTNWQNIVTNVSFQQTNIGSPGAGTTNCNIVLDCTILSLTSTPSVCNNGTFNVNGTIEFTNPPADGVLLIEDITAVPPIQKTYYPPFTSPHNYTISDIPCDGLVHTLTASFTGSTNPCSLPVTYQAPVAPCPSGLISGGGTICDDGTSKTTVNIAISGPPGPYNFTYAINGTPQTPITNYSGPFPYPINTKIPGSYTLVSVSTLACPTAGTFTGTATVNVNPIPDVIPAVSSPVTICSQADAQVSLSSSVPGTTFTWAASGNASTIAPVPSTISGSGNILQNLANSGNILEPVVFHIMPVAAGCSPASSTNFTFKVNPVPVVQTSPSTIQEICSHISTQPITLNTNVIGLVPTYNWTCVCDPNLSNCPPPGGTSNPITSFTPDNPTSVQKAITYNIVASLSSTSGSCISQAAEYGILVYPLPVSTFTGNITACQLHPDAYLYTANSGPPCSYTWSITPDNSYGSISNKNVSPASITWNTPGTTNLKLDAVTGFGCSTNASQQIQINPRPVVSITSCFDTETNRSAKRFYLKGGTPLQGIYIITQTPPADVFYPSDGKYYFEPSKVPGTGVIKYYISYKYTNQFNCPATTNNAIPLTVRPQNTPCGSSITDYRFGNITYPTALLEDNKCWMLENLRYGQSPPASTPQTDNCIVERNCLTSDPTCANYGGLYQWDELIQYGLTDGPAYQGVCPPGWHIPSSLEWQGLIDAVAGLGPGIHGDGLAGGSLKDTLLSNGFHGMLKGIYYHDNTWAFTFGSTTTATMFWTSTIDDLDPTESRAIARGLNNRNYGVSRYPASKANAFPVRCVRD